MPRLTDKGVPSHPLLRPLTPEGTPEATVTTHRETPAPEAPEPSHREQGDRLPSWSVGTWVVVCGLGLTLAGVIAGGAVTADHVARLEDWKKDHTAEVSKRREETDARMRGLEDRERTTTADHDKRLVLLEDRWGEVLRRLTNIETAVSKSH